ncbi:MAG: hypothetical protein LAO19_09000 [Acidobacteriia bacterium]|nr:hypothetical protein [Terriglobia bacterium]
MPAVLPAQVLQISVAAENTHIPPVADSNSAPIQPTQPKVPSATVPNRLPESTPLADSNRAPIPASQPKAPPAAVPNRAPESTPVANPGIPTLRHIAMLYTNAFANPLPAAIFPAEAPNIPNANQKSAAAPIANTNGFAASGPQPDVSPIPIPQQTATTAQPASVTDNADNNVRMPTENLNSISDAIRNAFPLPVTLGDSPRPASEKQKSSTAAPAAQFGSSTQLAAQNVATVVAPAPAAFLSLLPDMTGAAQLASTPTQSNPASIPSPVPGPQFQGSQRPPKAIHGNVPAGNGNFARLEGLPKTAMEASGISMPEAGSVPAAAVSTTPAPSPAAINDPASGAAFSIVQSIAPVKVAMAAAKPATVVAPVPTLHESISSNASIQAEPSGDAAPNSKPQGKGASNGSTGNEAGAKPDRNPPASGAAQDTRTFTSSIDAAAASPHAGAIPTVDTAAAGAAAHDSSTTRPPSTDAGSSANSGPSLRQALTAPAADGTMSVVSATRTLGHSGGTEVRIELQSDSLGSVELRAHVSGNQIGARCTAR